MNRRHSFLEMLISTMKRNGKEFRLALILEQAGCFRVNPGVFLGRTQANHT